MHLLLALDAARATRARELAARQVLQVQFDFYGVKVQVHTNSSYLADHLRLGYGFFEVRDGGAPHLSLLALEASEAHYAESVETLLPGREAGDHILVPMQMGLIFVLRGRSLLAFYTVTTLFGQVVARLRQRFVCLHAATLAHEGRGLILCGGARCGKSVLTVLLLEQAVGYTSDDVTLLTRGRLEVVPFPRAINIRNDYLPLVAPLLARARRVRRFHVADQERLLVDVAHEVPDKVEPWVICLPRYEPERKAEIQPLSPAVALAGLMHHRFHPLGHPFDDHIADDFETLSRLISQVSCFSLVFSDPVKAALLLKELLLQERRQR